MEAEVRGWEWMALAGKCKIFLTLPWQHMPTFNLFQHSQSQGKFVLRVLSCFPSQERHQNKLKLVGTCHQSKSSKVLHHLAKVIHSPHTFQLGYRLRFEWNNVRFPSARFQKLPSPKFIYKFHLSMTIHFWGAKLITFSWCRAGSWHGAVFQAKTKKNNYSQGQRTSNQA